MNSAQAKRVLETALLCASQPVAVRDLRLLFADALGADTIKQLLEELQLDWATRGLALVQVASGWRFQSRPELREYLHRLNPEKPPKYTRAVLETLAIIAYRQPMLRSELEAIRGVACGEVLKSLLERRLVRITGRAEELGRPMLYGTTTEFLKVFGLSRIEDLPQAKELRNPQR
jgi:segregation and condensation protein B